MTLKFILTNDKSMWRHTDRLIMYHTHCDASLRSMRYNTLVYITLRRQIEITVISTCMCTSHGTTPH